jgi:hypothetical protein
MRTDLQSVSFNHSDTYPHHKPKTVKTFGATHRNRTDNLPITNRVLYRIELEWRKTPEQKLARVETVTLRANRVKRLIDVIQNH